MLLTNASPKKQVLLILAAAIAIALGAYAFALMKFSSDDDRVRGVIEESYQATFSGTSTCLPHKDSDGPHTMECAFGLKTDEGPFIALDLSVLQTEAGTDLQDGSHMTVHGLFTPADKMSEDRLTIYDIIGVLRVTSVVK